MKLTTTTITINKPHLSKNAKCWLAIGDTSVQVDGNYATTEPIDAFTTKIEADIKAKANKDKAK